ncbi:unnamed protein product, partial [Prorocentrum cordatum]
QPTNASLLTLLFRTLTRYEPFLFDRIAAPILNSHAPAGTMWIGKTTVGKSTASKTIGFVVSAYPIEKRRRADIRPSAVAAKNIDFLRLEPSIADDNVLTKWDPDEIKAFLDPGEENALPWAKWWCGASFEQNQFRQVCVNPRNNEFEAKVRSVSRDNEEVSFVDLFKTTDCNFAGAMQSGCEMADVELCMARSNVELLAQN